MTEKDYHLGPAEGQAVQVKKIDLAKALNQQQLAVVSAPGGPMLVIAGAGSGKTRVITYRVAYLLGQGVSPTRILLLTFTNKAAQEMLHRVELLTGLSLKNLWGGTFHHVCARILRQNHKEIGFNKNFTIIDNPDSLELLEECTELAKVDVGRKLFPQPKVLKEILSYSINAGISLEQSITNKGFHFLAQKDKMEQIFALYDHQKKKAGYLDFDDLLVMTVQLLTARPEIAAKYAEQFQHVLVDEYQDTNHLQASIVEVLAGKHKNVMAVGDDSQSIYSFRGADFQNILQFPKKYPGTKIYKIETNYRSTPQVIDLTNQIIKAATQKFPKSLRAVRKDGEMPVLVPVDDVNQQAQFVAQRILELNRQGIALSEMAVLYRAHYHSMELQMELVRRDIPFEIRSGLRFFEQAHIKDVLSYLRIVQQVTDEIALKRILRIMPGIGRGIAAKIYEAISTAKSPADFFLSEGMAKLVPKNAQEPWRWLRDFFRRSRDNERIAPAEMIAEILDGGYAQYLENNFPNAPARLEDLQQMALWCQQYPDLTSFLNQVALMGELSGEDVAGREEDTDHLILTTVHQAKGLEWKAVFVIWLTEGHFPLGRASIDENDLEEERRLFYVASTRAKDILYLIYPMMSNIRGIGGVIGRPSRFLEDIKNDFYERWNIYT